MLFGFETVWSFRPLDFRPEHLRGIRVSRERQQDDLTPGDKVRRSLEQHGPDVQPGLSAVLSVRLFSKQFALKRIRTFACFFQAERQAEPGGDDQLHGAALHPRRDQLHQQHVRGQVRSGADRAHQPALHLLLASERQAANRSCLLMTLSV